MKRCPSSPLMRDRWAMPLLRRQSWPWAATKSVCLVAVAVALGTLGGCGNAYQHLPMGKWQEVGRPETPVKTNEGTFVITTAVAGEGPAVAAGDLVKVRVTVTTVDPYGRTNYNPKPNQVAWVWTGRGPQTNAANRVYDMATFGELGGERPRAALIGRHLHEQFEMHLEHGADPWTGHVPVCQCAASSTPSRLDWTRSASSTISGWGRANGQP